MSVSTKIKDFFEMRKLIKQLKDKNVYVRLNAAEALTAAVEKGKDITDAVPALANALGDKGAIVKRNAAWALSAAAEKGQDITDAVPTLANALGDENMNVRWNAAWALAYHYLNRVDENKITELLSHEDAIVKDGAAQALENFVSKCNSIEKLNEVQAVIEKSFKKWFDKNRNTNDPLKMALIANVKYTASQLLVKIAKRKAELARDMQGEILSGEVVKPPGNKVGRWVYRAMMMVKNQAPSGKIIRRKLPN